MYNRFFPTSINGSKRRYIVNLVSNISTCTNISISKILNTVIYSLSIICYPISFSPEPLWISLFNIPHSF
nr:MAG TPA: hypothetical protein [Caudoviricetes sp.]